MGLESLSEPDDLDMDMDEEEEEDEEDGERFFDTRSQSASTSSGGGRDQGPNKSDELDTEEDPVDPITPGPGVRSFEPRAVEKENEPGGVVVVVESDGVEDDDWVDPSLPSPVASPPVPRSLVGPPPQRSGSIDLAAFAKGKSALGKKGKKPSKRSRSGSGAVVVKTPVPPVVRPQDAQEQLVDQQQQQRQRQHSSFPFPMTQKSADDVPTPLPEERPRGSSSVLKGKRMHTAKARDGGRTQSGGVKGVLPTSDD